MHSLASFFRTQGFSEHEADRIADRFVPKEMSKGDFFAQEGKISQYLGFVEKGFLQYYLLLDGEEKTTYVVGENNFVASLVSFLKQTPSLENIRAMTDSWVWVIQRDDLKALQSSIPAFQTYYVGILERQICCIDESRLDALVLTAQERYEKMLNKEPGLIQQIPLQNLASILGVTPRHLSRIRNNIR